MNYQELREGLESIWGDYLKLLKVALSDFVGESRDLREMKVARDIGIRVSVLCDESVNFKGNNIIDGFEVHRIPLLHRDKSLLIMMIRMIPGMFRWIRYIQRLRPDIASCHDIIPLFIAYLAKVFSISNRNMKLIYDSHELEMDRSLNKRRKKWMKRPLMILEKYLINHSDSTIVVSDSIADVLVKTYNLRTEISVVRNIPNFWIVDKNTCNKVRKDLCEQMGWSISDFIIMYHGSVSPGRGIEYAIQSITILKNCKMVIMGNGPLKEELVSMSKKLNIDSNLLFIPPVKQDIMWKYIGAIDVGLCILENTNRNHYLALPNKLFECIQAEVPLIASNFPEISKIVNKYKVGLCCRPDDVSDLAQCIRRMQSDSNLYESFKNNCKDAKKDLCWEKEQKIIQKIYYQYIDSAI